MSDPHFLAPISQQIWEKKYRLHDAQKNPLEADVTDTWRRIAKALAAPEGKKSERFEEEFYRALSGFKFLPAGRIIAGAGTGRKVTLFNCFVMGTIPDSMAGIFDMLKEAALTMQQGGGIGYDFSTLRPQGDEVKGVAADASGPLTFMDVWDAMCRTVMSAGSRRGAMMATMRCDHPDIEKFIVAKHDPVRLRMFNLSVLITDEFMAAKERDDDSFDLVFNGRVHKTVSARDLWNKIMRSTYDTAEPGVIFIDRINQTNNLHYLEKIASTNPCGEQPLPPYGACLLGSINMPMMVKKAFTPEAGISDVELAELVTTAVRMMDNVIDISNFPLPQQEAEAKMKRRIGLGVTGIADALIMCGLTYGSPEAVQREKTWMSLIDHAAYSASCDLAAEKGSFPGFAVDEFLKKGTHASTMNTFVQNKIRKHGIRNSHLTSVAPTGTISLYAGNVSSGIEPVFAFHYTRTILNDDGSKRFESVEDYAYRAYLNFLGDYQGDPVLPEYFVNAQTLDPAAHVRMQAVAQAHVDSSISKTINMPVDVAFDDFKDVYQQAWDSGCKGCTTYRPNEVTGSILSVTEAPAEAVEDPRVEIADEELRSAAMSFLSGHNSKAHVASLSKKLSEMGLGKLLDAKSTAERYELMEFLLPVSKDGWDYVQAPAQEAPTVRPESLLGATYKVKWPNSPHALYITINDIVENGQRRPFECFFNSKNMDHFAWTVALSRMISAVFRRPQDSSFVVEELKAVFDPKGGAWMGGTFVPSVLAAIGGEIEKHMISIGYIGGTKETSEPQMGTVREPRRVTLSEARTAPYGDPRPSMACSACGGFNVYKESGCFSCKDCGNSNCG